MLVNASVANQYVSIVQDALKIFTFLQLAELQFPGQNFIPGGQSYDYIIVGGGTAGCVIANRLAEDKQTSVLLIEAGGFPEDESNIPSFMMFMQQSKYSWNYTVEDSGLAEIFKKKIRNKMSLGRVLGGSSSIGYLLYSPGNHYDYDSWADIVNDETWSWKHVLPYLQKSQKVLDSKLANTANGKLYGKNGKIGLTSSRYELGEKFLTAFQQMGNKRVDSFNGNVSVGYSDAVYTLADGFRQSTAFTYLSPIKSKKNLHVLLKTVVKRVIFDENKNAIGVEVVTSDKKNIIYKSRKEVILSAGVINSPKILMLSGIGKKKHLRKHDIKVIADLPVGRNLQDQLSTVLVYNMTSLVVHFKLWSACEYPAAVLVGFTSLNKTDDRPNYQSINFINYPLYLMMYCTFAYGYIDDICNNMLKTDTNTAMMYSVISKRNYKSRGKVLLRSGDYKDDPIIYPHYYSDDEDLEEYADAIEDFVKIEETEQFKKMGGEFKDPELTSCKRFKRYSRKYWKCYIKYMSTSLHNYSGTCAMGRVVDSRLRVYGVKRLRVADAGVMPFPTAGGILGATIMIGEKVSDMIKNDNKDDY